MRVATQAGLEVLPSLGAPPRWAAKADDAAGPDSGAQRGGWTAFVNAAAKRYGPHGEFWRNTTTGPGPTTNRRPEGPDPHLADLERGELLLLRLPGLGARLRQPLTISSKAIKSVAAERQGHHRRPLRAPTVGGKRGQSAAGFLEELYRYPGIKSRFDGIDLHPYAVDSETLEEEVEEFHEAAVKAHDRPTLYITEMGWGSQNDFNHDAYEQGKAGQIKQLKGAYAYLTANARRLNLKGVYWFSWKDLKGSCDFCDSVGLFQEGPKFKPKPAWRAFVGITGGRARP